MTLADPKPTPRTRDKAVYAEFHSQPNLRCLHCGDPKVEAAHLLRGINREDVLAALIPLCPAAHGAFDTGNRYKTNGKEWTEPKAVRLAVARFLRSEEGAANAAYLIEKLGTWAAEAYVLRLEGRAF